MLNFLGIKIDADSYANTGQSVSVFGCQWTMITGSEFGFG